MVPLSVSDEQLAEKGLPGRYASHYHEYSKDNYWTSEKMVDHTVKTAIPIFQEAFPGCTAVFAFDNTTNHFSYTSDALRVEKLNKGPSGAQPCMREGFITIKGLPQTMQLKNYYNFTLTGEPKGMKQILVVEPRILCKLSKL